MGNKLSSQEIKNRCASRQDIIDIIDQLAINEDTKMSLKYWVSQRRQGRNCADIIYGMALALRNEVFLTQEEFLTIITFAREGDHSWSNVPRKSLWERLKSLFRIPH